MSQLLASGLSGSIVNAFAASLSSTYAATAVAFLASVFGALLVPDGARRSVILFGGAGAGLATLAVLLLRLRVGALDDPEVLRAYEQPSLWLTTGAAVGSALLIARRRGAPAGVLTGALVTALALAGFELVMAASGIDVDVLTWLLRQWVSHGR